MKLILKVWEAEMVNGIENTSWWFQTSYFSRAVECSSLREIEANINLVVQLKERKTWGTLGLHSLIVMETYIQRGYIGDIPTWNVSHFQSHYSWPSSSFNGWSMVRGAVSINDLVLWNLWWCQWLLQIECEEYLVEYYQSHITLLWIWIMLWCPSE